MEGNYMIKYTVSGLQGFGILQNADEIRLQYKDHKYLIDLVKRYEGKSFIIRIPIGTEVDWETLKSYGQITDVTLALEDLHMIKFAQENMLKYYWAYPVTTWYELRSMITLGVDQILVGAPLFFEIGKVHAKFNNLRIVANNAQENPATPGSHINGPYVRPEDVKYYEPYVQHIEFFCDKLTEEAQLLEIYKEGKWEGNLNFLVRNLNANVTNRLIPEEFGQFRTKCGQRCMSSGTCHYCETTFNMVNAARNVILDEQLKNKNT